MEKNKKLRFILVGVVLFMLVFGFYLTSNNNVDQRITYKQIKVAKGDIAVRILSTGTVEPENRLEIKPPIPGRIENVLVKEGDKVKKGELLAWMSSTERAALLDAARSKGKGELSRWEDYYKPTPIIAPIDGMIILRNVEAGQTFTNQEPILVMSNQLSVKAQVDETDLGLVKLGQLASITLDAYPNQSFKGLVKHIAYEAKIISNVTTYEVDVIPTNSPHFVRSGMTANVTFTVASKNDTLLIPVAALTSKDKKKTVQIMDPLSQSYDLKTVKVGISDGKFIEILEGLKEGDTVLIPQVSALKTKRGVNPFGPVGGKRDIKKQ